MLGVTSTTPVLAPLFVEMELFWALKYVMMATRFLEMAAILTALLSRMIIYVQDLYESLSEAILKSLELRSVMMATLSQAMDETLLVILLKLDGLASLGLQIPAQYEALYEEMV